mmetsp:Transcript_28773/g.54604  ORF Transcript_28773/g.54604 Transcript_28773/m.54604 type:complete len:252 (+) Transcript_28773:1858-2613(+)
MPRRATLGVRCGCQDKRMCHPFGGQLQAGHQIAGEKWGIGSGGHNALCTLVSGPVQPGQYTGQRPCKPIDAVGNHRQIKPVKPRRIAIGIQRQTRHLWTQPVNHMPQQRGSPKRQQPLVATAHTRSLPTRQNHTDGLFHAAPLRPDLRGSSATAAGSASRTKRSSPLRQTKRCPRIRPIKVRPTCCAISTPQAVNPEREASTGMPIIAVLITISDVSRPVVYRILSSAGTSLAIIQPAILSTALWRPTSSI